MQVTYHIFSYRFLKGAWRAKHIVLEIDYSPILRDRRRKGSEKKSQREGDWRFRVFPFSPSSSSSFLVVVIIIITIIIIIIIIIDYYYHYCQRGNRAKTRGCLSGRFIMPRNVGRNSQILRNPLKFAFLNIFGCK